MEDNIFYDNKEDLQTSCCDQEHDKLEVYRLFPDGYRVFCTECCAMADGPTIAVAIDHFQNQRFHFPPLI